MVAPWNVLQLGDVAGEKFHGKIARESVIARVRFLRPQQRAHFSLHPARLRLVLARGGARRGKDKPSASFKMKEKIKNKNK